MDLFAPPTPKRDVFTVSRLNREVRALLEGNLPLLWLEGEVSNFSSPSSGHWYFSLKDSKAQVRCAMFRNRNMRVRTRPQNGDKILVRARISVYEPRGEYQLLAEHIEPVGEGDLQRQFEALKNQLQAEGLFDPATKQDLPAFPQRIGVITSATGAALRDVLSVIERRYPSGQALVYPVLVQGNEASYDIVQAIKLANQRQDCDVLLLVRGGGSLEDLWAFNEERVARTIADSELPMVSGVGHETDFTIADFVADRRAPTPSVAAEMVTPDSAELITRTEQLTQRMSEQLRRQLKRDQQQLTHIQHRLSLQHPRRQLQQQSQRMDELQLRMQRAMQNTFNQNQLHYQRLSSRLFQQRPDSLLELNKTKLVDTREALKRAISQQLNRHHQALALASRGLNAVSPLKTLERGYAIALSEDGKAIRSETEVSTGDKLTVRLAKGEIKATVN